MRYRRQMSRYCWRLMTTMRWVNAASILGVIALGIDQGDYVTLTADGANAEAALDELAELLTTDHDAEG